MPVNDTELKNMLDLANKELDSNDDKRSKLKVFIRDCQEITKVPTKDDPKVMEIGRDKSLGTKMSSARRLDIWNKLVADKTDLGL